MMPGIWAYVSCLQALHHLCGVTVEVVDALQCTAVLTQAFMCLHVASKYKCLRPVSLNSLELLISSFLLYIYIVQQEYVCIYVYCITLVELRLVCAFVQVSMSSAIRVQHSTADAVLCEHSWCSQNGQGWWRCCNSPIQGLAAGRGARTVGNCHHGEDGHLPS